jgi:hypothetical protein
LKQVWPHEGRELNAMVEVVDVVVVLDVGVAVMCEVEEDDLDVVEEADVVLTELQSPNSGWLYTQCGQYQGTDNGIRRKEKRSTHHPVPQSDARTPQMPSLLQHVPYTTLQV